MEKPTGKPRLIMIGLMVMVCSVLYITTTANVGGEKQKKEEKRMLSTLEETLEQMEGLGNVKVYFHYDEKEEESPLANYFSASTTSKSQSPLQGLLVVADGADDPAVRNGLSQLLANVLQLPEHRIVIVEMKKRGNQHESQ